MTYATATWIFLRALGVIYAVAFASLAREARGLWGSRGVLPINEYLNALAPHLDAPRWPKVPTLFWFASGDAWITGAAVVGVLAGVLAATGCVTGPALSLCFVLYLSFVTAGQDFMSFQWDILLLEVGFVALFVAPWSTWFSLFTAAEPPVMVRAAMLGVLFKLMFLSGVVKLLSGDPAWRDLTALSYHYWTQPLPNPLSLFAHAAPGAVHRMATAGTFAVELGLPFAMFWPAARPFAALGFAGLSLFIAITGNYTFFNLLTIALATWLVTDAWWGGVLPKLGVSVAPTEPASWALAPVVVIAGGLLAADAYWCARPWLPRGIERTLAPAVNILRGAYLTSSYGLFATMTKTRPEIVIEGSADGRRWAEYVFKFKPGPLDRRPPVIAPLQPRLDWQMWFAALGSFRGSPFVGALMAQLFENAPEVKMFFATDPFPDEPPRYLRARLYEYEFRSPGGWWATGEWWTRREVGDYSPTFQRR